MMNRLIALSLLLSLPLNAQEVIFSNGFENTPPVIISTPVTEGEAGVAYSYDVDATDVDGDLLAYYLLNSPDGMSMDAATGEISWTPSNAGYFPVTVEVADGQRGFANQSWSITVLPPDPFDIAPENDPNVSTTIFHSTEFLYTGDGAVQTGVAEGTIDPARVAVIRGSVRSRDSEPLAGVKITIHNHDEYGLTLSRADGAFDMVVNGGGTLVVNYSAKGHLPAQRKLDLPWQNYVYAPDVVLVRLDPIVTTVDLDSSTGMQVARGSVQNDGNGDRRATVMLPQGTAAELQMPDGSVLPISTLGIRATEYTVGENGPETMPGELPPTSGYTYAVELSVDEAISAGATMVRFDQPLPFYVENFLGFPTGITVPSGFYDRNIAAWVPSDNGRIVEVIGITDGKAELDIEGDGVIADSSALATLGISEAELEHLASLYTTGDSLWRVPIPHFTPWDHNWPYGPPLDAIEPNQSLPTGPGTHVDSACEVSGSIIECQNQVLGERLPIQGTEFTLNYRSNRQKGFKALNSTMISLTDDTLPASVTRVVLDMSISGQLVHETYDPALGLSRDFEWNGEDAYGRPVSGTQTLSGSIRYVYPYVYYESPAEFENAFARTGFVSMDGIDDRIGGEFSLNQNFSLKLGTPPRNSTPIAGWSLDVHHSFDPVNGTLYLGDGVQRKSGTNKIERIARNGRCASIYAAMIKIGPDGSIYYVEQCYPNGTYNFRAPIKIQRQYPDGAITTVAGGGDDELSNAIPATNAKIGSLTDIELADDGSIYYSTGAVNPGGCQVRRVSPEGLVYTVMNQAGTDNCRSTTSVFSPGNALDFGYLISPGFELTSDNRIIFSVRDLNRILQIDQDGYMSEVAGSRPPNGSWQNGTYFCGLNDSILEGEGGPAILAEFCEPFHIVVDQEDNIYFQSNLMILKVSTHGVLTRLAGVVRWLDDGVRDGDGGPAVDARIGPGYMSTSDDGTLYFSESGGGYASIRAVYADGLINTVAGGLMGPGGGTGEGGPARLATFGSVAATDVGPDGSLYIIDGSEAGISKVSPVFPDYRGVDISLPSEDGSLVYQFDEVGRHLRTISSLTAVVIYDFNYDSEGRLITVADGYGNTTSIERDGSGTPTTIIAPFGQRTDLTVDSDGYLASMSNPASESTTLLYETGGLLTQITDPLGHFSTYSYDTMGRLEQATNKESQSRTFIRTEIDDGIEILNTSAEGHETLYKIQRDFNDNLLVTNTFPGGMMHEGTIGQDGQSTVETGYEINRFVSRQADPRFGMLSPIRSESAESTPLGLARGRTASRSAVLNNPNDPLSIQSAIQTSSIEGRTTTLSYEAASSTIVKTSPTGRQTKTVLDARQRPVSIETTGFGILTYAYDGSGRISERTFGSGDDEFLVEYNFDSLGRLSAITNPLTNQVSFEYDQADRLTRLVFPDNRDVMMGYDAAGRLTSVTTPNGANHSFEFSPSGLLRNYYPPAVTGGGNRTYSYDNDGLLTGWLRGDGKQVTLIYDAAVRLAEQQLPTGNFVFSYDGANRLSNLVAPSGVNLSYTFDADLMLDETWSGPVTGTVSRSYRNDFALSGFSVNGQPAFTLNYTDEGALSLAGDLTISHDAVTSELIGTTLGLVTELFTSSLSGNMESQITKFSDSVIFEASYGYDGLGRLTGKTETVGGTTTIYEYKYDSTGRLTEVAEDSIVTAIFDYDDNDNLTNTNAIVATFNARDWLLSHGGKSYEYNGDGERTSKTTAQGTTTYDYDALGNLVSVSLPDGRVIDYLVDGHGRRVGKLVDAVFSNGYLYLDERSPIAEVDSEGNVVTLYVYGIGLATPSYVVRDNKTYRLVTDLLESVRLVIDIDTGDIIQRLDYDAWGNITLDTNPGFQPFAFAGGMLDSDTGLYRMGKRDYDAVTGRWTTPDPLGLGPGFNVYAYVGNNPVSKTDPTGLSPDMRGMCSAAAGEEQCPASLRDLGYSSAQSTEDILGSGYVQDDGRLPINPSYTHRDDKCGVSGNIASGAVGRPGGKRGSGLWSNCNVGQSCLGGYQMIQVGRFEVIGCFANSGPIVTRAYEIDWYVGPDRLMRWLDGHLPQAPATGSNCAVGVRG